LRSATESVDSPSLLEVKSLERVFLSRRNVEVLLSKLDRLKRGERTACVIIKRDHVHPKFPQTMDAIEVHILEDADYYIERPPGKVDAVDDPEKNNGSERNTELSRRDRTTETGTPDSGGS
jgi:hypothetical protein